VTRPTAVRMIGAAVLLLAVLSGCAGPVPSPSASPSSTVVLPSGDASPAPTPDITAATDGRVIVGVTQGRSDYAAGVFALTVENTTDEELSVRSAVLRSPAFRADVVWEGDAIVPPGSTRDLRVPVPDVACPLTDRSLALTVGYRLGDVDASAALIPLDPYAVIDRLSESGCLAEAVAAVVDIRLSDDLSVVGSGSSATASLSLVLRPVGDLSAGHATIVSVDATTLLSPADGSARWDVGETISAGDDRRTVILTAIPARCDAHAIAEDKVGTLLRVRVRLPDGTEGPVTVAASPELRSALYGFIADACSA
jgi:hypothetical protein